VTTLLRVTCLLSLLLLAGVPRPALASQIQITFEEMAQSSDLIFIGTADSQSACFNDRKTMIFTDVLFRDIQLIHATGKSVQRDGSTIKVTYPGGELNGVGIDVTAGQTPRAGRG
jgi:hypothetical protein